jgi:hypothetical protein
VTFVAHQTPLLKAVQIALAVSARPLAKLLLINP